MLDIQEKEFEKVNGAAPTDRADVLRHVGEDAKNDSALVVVTQRVSAHRSHGVPNFQHASGLFDQHWFT